MTVRELLHRIDSHELTEWLAFMRLESEPPKPPVQSAAEIRAGLAHLVRKKA